MSSKNFNYLVTFSTSIFFSFNFHQNIEKHFIKKFSGECKKNICVSVLIKHLLIAKGRLKKNLMHILSHNALQYQQFFLQHFKIDWIKDMRQKIFCTFQCLSEKNCCLFISSRFRKFSQVFLLTSLQTQIKMF